MTDQLPNKKRKPWWFKLLVALGLLIIIVLAAALWIDATGRNQLNRAIADAHALGQPVTFEEILAQRKSWPAEQDAGQYFVTFASRLDDVAALDGISQLPLVGNIDLPACGHLWSTEQQALVAEKLAELAPLIAEINHLRDYPGGNIPLVVAENPLCTLLPELSRIRFSLKLKSLEIIHKAMNGDTSALIDDLIILSRHNQILADHPTLLSSLVRTACDNTMVRIVEQINALAVLQAHQLDQIEQQFSAMEAEDLIHWGMLGERAFFIASAQYLINGGHIDFSSLEGGETHLPGELASSPRILGLRGWFLRDEAMGVEMCTRLIQDSQRSHNAIAVFKQFDIQTQTKLSNSSFPKILMPSYLRTYQQTSTRTAYLRAARLALASERYRIENSRFPDRLDQLVPEYMKELPRDPFDDQALRYKLTSDAAIVYSIGEDGVDNGGDVQRTKGNRHPADAGFTVLKPERRRLPAETRDSATQTAPAAK